MSSAESKPQTRQPEDLRGPRGLAVFAATAIVFAIADLATKHVAFMNIGEYPDRVVVFDSWFHFIRSVNRGAAFGQMQGQFSFFYVVSVAAMALLSYFSWTAERSGKGYQISLGLVASGVLGNLHDRLFLGGVRDFIDWFVPESTAAGRWLIEKFGTNHWPTFNVADACICVGTALLIVKFWRDEKHERRMQEIHEHNEPFRKRPGADAPAGG